MSATKMKCFAVRHNNKDEYFYMHFGSRWWVELFKMEPVIEVELEIIPDNKALETDYYGFYNFKDDGILPVEEGLGEHPAVYYAKELLDMHYNGVQSEINRGRGKMVRVRVTQVKSDIIRREKP